MTDQEAHEPTEQETAIYDALTAGDHDAIEDMRIAALEADLTPPDPTPDDWLSPVQQYGIDHANAHGHYQADHEAPEDEREQATVEQAQQENQTAG